MPKGKGAKQAAKGGAGEMSSMYRLCSTYSRSTASESASGGGGKTKKGGNAVKVNYSCN